VTREQIICDECKAVKGEANHWHRIFVATQSPEQVAIVLGSAAKDCSLPGYGDHINPPWERGQRDLCGERCLMLHINRLLKLNGTGPLPTRDEQRELEKQAS
jgi:hypothetical protein